MYVCICQAVTERHVQEAVAQGARCMRELANATGCGSQCGRCARSAREVLRAALALEVGNPVGAQAGTHAGITPISAAAERAARRPETLQIQTCPA